MITMLFAAASPNERLGSDIFYSFGLLGECFLVKRIYILMSYFV